MGGTSVPTLFGLVAAIWHKSIGTEVPPTKAALSRKNEKAGDRSPAFAVARKLALIRR
ncbi:DUF6053 domain-containing protein [Lysobacter enzymogenes]|uniref:DUF6053 domain-containing protein n=1 Tax=Lysobacter enzymogenes TaxID=69 RepID=UPI003D18819F